jgi:DNA-directed RNA polymerase specialized sigma24 family protein
MDALFEPWLQARQEGEEECLADLMRCAEPIIRRVVTGRLAGSWDDIDDVCSEARLELLLYLRRLKANPAGKSIDEFSSYVASLALNTCNHYFRRRRPGLARLRRQIRHLLEHDPMFRLDESVCGLSRWPRRMPRAYPQSAAGIEGDRDLGVLLERMLEHAAGPVALVTLVELVSSIWRIAPEPLASSELLDPETTAGPPANLDLLIDQRRSAARLWREIGELPRGQRVALLLNLRDGTGNSVLSLFPLLGIASLTEIAAVLEIRESELERIWNDLPWDDNALGRLLTCSRQQVINLRMAGRKRLANRVRMGSNTRPFGASDSESGGS